MTVSDIIKDDMTTDNKPRFIWIRNGATTGNYVNVNHIVYVGKNLYKKNEHLGLVATSATTGHSFADDKQTIYLTEWDTADDVIRKIQAALAQ